ncbi:peptidase family M13 [Colletotrichum karsti]|uniref:Peptidase family M13 n=1 Tax=Colletotrichum karsti TaxID=1095194 RepID=A0A9P6LJ70_9PEZI|nr:peptidase family M13 [Colletotrichum karsti]KAF9874906.1 peptidase family M13 [Colletotrichum karsti]
MEEKEPLIVSGDESGEPKPRCPYAGRCSAGKRVAKVFTLAAVVGMLYFGIPQAQQHFAADRAEKMCTTPACVHAASEILYNLSPNYKELDPCNDFEELVCGGWRDRHDLRSDQGDAFTGTIMSENSELLLRHILEAPYPKDSKVSKPARSGGATLTNRQHSAFSPLKLFSGDKDADEENFDKMKAVYDACINEDKIKEVGLEPLTQILDQIKQAYPLEGAAKVDEPKPTKDTILLLAKYGVNAFVAAGTGADDRDPDSVVVSVGAPYDLGLPSKERYEDEKLVEKYRSVAVEVLGNLFPDNNKDNFAKVIDLERMLAAASPSTEEREDVTFYYNPMLIDEASALTPEIELTALIHDLAPENFVVERVIVMAPKYLTELNTILAETDKEVIQNFFVWKAVQELHEYIDADAVKPYKRFVNELAGKDPESVPERWRTCVGEVDNGVGWILSRFFVEKAFSEKAKKFGDTIITDIKNEFTRKLKATKWMDKQTTKKAIDKVHNIIQKIGYPTKSPNIMDPPSLNKYYDSVNLNPDSFFQNALEVNKFAVSYEWSALGKPVDREQWGMTVPTVNAYYNPPGNEIVFPAGIMQFPVFDVEVPAYMSYGAFGSVAGHELSHAFDSTGRHYDQNGNYTDWWTDDTVKAFQERAECFVEQYSNFTVPGPDDEPLHVNGRLTLGENIADAGGLSASFQAWKRRAHEKPNKNLPGLEHFTQEQLFFVTYSNWWCGKSRKDTAINRIYTDPHAPKWARILGTMANSREFRDSFQCKSKKPTCELW